jgi:hypothetical protein
MASVEMSKPALPTVGSKANYSCPISYSFDGTLLAANRTYHATCNSSNAWTYDFLSDLRCLPVQHCASSFLPPPGATTEVLLSSNYTTDVGHIRVGNVFVYNYNKYTEYFTCTMDGSWTSSRTCRFLPV